MSQRFDMIAALDAKQQAVYREAREAGFGIDYSITLARKSGDLPGHEKPGHWVRHQPKRIQRGDLMRYVYVSKPGGKPLNIGINNAKRIARSADKRDQLIVLTKLGPGLPREHGHHQELVKRRHRYYHDQHQET